MIPALALAVFLQVAAQSATEPKKPTRDPRTQALTTADALWSIPDVSGRVIAVGDFDGDGRGDLFVERGARPHSTRIDAVSSRDGHTIRTIYTFDATPRDGFVWDAGGDADGDGASDLVLGFPAASPSGDHSGAVLLISGKTGAVLTTLNGEASGDRAGSAIAFVGDVDGDGHADFAFGAPGVELEILNLPEAVAGFGHYSGEAEGESIVILKDGTRLAASKYWRTRLVQSSFELGHVSLRSGRDGHEIRRIVGSSAGQGFGSRVVAMHSSRTHDPTELLVQCDQHSDEALRIISIQSGATRIAVAPRFGWAGCAGDLDGDGVADLFLDAMDTDAFIGRMGASRFVSGADAKTLFELPYPDMWSEYGITVALGDVDGDGIDDIALGEANFNLNGPNSPAHEMHPVELEKLSLDQACSLVSDPWCSFTWESGCAIAYSGRTHRAIFGVWAQPDSRQGLGLEVTALPDLNGDGLPEILVTDESNAYAFAGPGKAAK